MGLTPILSSKKRKQASQQGAAGSTHRRRRSLLMEALESRQMMAGGPQLQSILPNEGPDLLNGVPLDVAPKELVFRFTDGQTINPTTLNAIRIFRSVDGVFGNGNDELLVPFDPGRPGFIGIGDRDNEVIVRFPTALPDDLYQVTIIGDPAGSPLRNVAGDPYNMGVNTTHTFELRLAPQVVAVVPQPIARFGGTLTQFRDQIEVYFDSADALDVFQAQNQQFYQLIFTNDTATTADDVVHFPVAVFYDSSTAKATLTFENDLALLSTGPGTYRLRIGDANVPPNAANPETPVLITPPTDAGSSFGSAHVVGALSQGSGTSTVVINGAIDPQTFLLNLPGGNNEPGHRDIPPEVEQHIPGADATQGISTIPYNFQNLYGFDPNGNPLFNGITETQKQRVREIFEFYGYYLGAQFIETPNAGITVAVGDVRAVDPNATNGPGGTLGIAGNGLVVMDLQEPWGNSEFGGFFFTVAMHEVGHALGLGHSTELPDLTVQSGTTPGSFGNTGELVFPGDYDIIHGQHRYRPESKDIDLYQFQLNEAGVFTAEIMAERLPNSSLLDSALTLFEEYSTLRTPNGGVAGLAGAAFTIDDGVNPPLTFNFIPTNTFPGFTGLTITYLEVESPESLARRMADAINAIAADPLFSLNVRAEAVGDVVKVRGLVNVSQPFPNSDLEVQAGVREIVARNDDYFSEDSSLTLHLGPGRYYIGVTSTGNTNYDPTIEDSGFGGTTQGEYQLRMNFQRDPLPSESITDEPILGTDQFGNIILIPGKRLDGDGDGREGGAFNYWFKVATEADTIFVDKTGFAGGNGSIFLPFTEIDQALAFATPGKIVRVVGNGGTDGDITTLHDAVPYMIGTNSFGQTLPDGRQLEVPRGVTLMIDAGAVFKMRGANIDVGSSAQGIDRSEGHLQVLGLPGLPVVFTSTRDELIGQDVEPTFPTTPSAGDWGGLVFRNDLDLGSPGRRVLEREGIFLNFVNQADIRYGGGQVTVNSVPQTFNPIHMIEARPTITFNTIVGSADAALSADPNSFRESRFYDNNPGTAYTADYDRVGPDIHGNVLSTLLLGPKIDVVNATSGLPVIITTAVPHGFATGERVRVSGVQGNLPANGDFTITVLSPTTFSLVGSIGGGAYVPSAGDFVQRLTVLDNSLNGLFVRVRTQAGSPIDRITTTTRFDDTDITHIITEALIIAGTPGGPLQVGGVAQARTDASLTIDPGIVIKSQGGRIEAQISTQLLAEGTAENPIIFTTLNDDRYGRGGSFDTNTDGTATSPVAGDWGGLFFDRLSHGSLDHVVISFAGGRSPIEGDFANFNAVEIHQADVRIANSMLRDNADGVSSTNRNNRGTNAATTIFVRGAQPVIVDNIIRDNEGQALNINANALNYHIVTDPGRSTGTLDARVVSYANHGPLLRGNRLAGNDVNGMVVRGAVLTTESIWDDTDIVHVLFDEVEVTNHHTFSGLRLQSNAEESLVIKLDGPTAGFTAGGRRLDISDRIGGTLQVVGTPGHPVIMTAMADDSVGAGLDPDGAPQRDTNGDGAGVGGGTLPTGPEVNNGTLIDNDVAPGIPGQFAFNAANGGNAGPGGGISAQGLNTLFSNLDVIFEFGNYVDTGANGQAVNLANTTITQPATLVAPDVVISAGTFMGPNGPINWQVESRFNNGEATLFNTITFSSAQPFGTTRFINYLDEDINNFTDDILVTRGTPGQPGFEVFTLDGPERIGFSQGGTYVPGPGLVNATFDGWTADQFNDLITAITGAGTAYSVPGNIDTTDLTPFLDPELGQAFGPADVTTAFAWSLDPTATSATITTTLRLIASNPGIPPGSWRSVRVEQFSNDRNVVVANELESATSATDQNRTPGAAQFLGELATDEKHSDEILRLGFEVHGTINLNNPNDVDVYSFNAQTGTEVWFDIDRTTHSLDTVIELVDANGTILARSDDSPLEGRTGVLPPNPFGPNLARLMQRDAFDGNDLYTTNPRDAGMRVVLPGAPGLRNTYFIRVRSKGVTVDDPNGLTTGVYQLQIRLREADEVPGSMIRNSDIRFATNGIEVIGMPGHSPLLGDASEVEGPTGNNTLATAQDIGNLLLSDRASLAVSGTLGSATDVDFYRFTVDYDLIQAISSGDIRSWGAVFDIDYADGIARPDTTISIFDANGTLLLTGRDSDIFEDQPAPLNGADADDLSRGSFGKLDPYIGSVQLPEGDSRTYYVAISSNRSLPAVLDATFQPTPTQPLVRLEPISSVRRIVEDRIGFTGGSTAAPSGALFNGSSPLELNLYANQFQLSDVVLFVNSPGDLFTVDPFTGITETDVTGQGVLPTPAANQSYRDIAMRSDGRLFAYAVFNGAQPSDANNGVFVELDPGTGQILRSASPGITTLEFNLNQPPQPGQQPPVQNRNRGYRVEALDFFEPSPSNRRLFTVGTIPGGQFSSAVDNVLFEMNPLTGVALADNVGANTPPSEPLPRGILDVGLNGVSLTVVAGSDPNLGDGDTFTVGPRTLEMDSGITLEVIQPGAAIPDGATFSVSDGAITVLYRFDKDPTTPAPPGAVEVPINDAMSAAQVAAAIAANFLSPISQVSPNPPLPNPLNGVLTAVHLNLLNPQQPTRVYINDLTPATPQHSANSGTGAVQVLGQAGVTAGNTRVTFTPFDNAAQIASNIEAALAANPIPGVTASAMANIVTFVVPPGAPPLNVVIPATTPFTSQNLPGGFGGIVTGIEFLGTSMFAVTDTGTLLRYELASFNSGSMLNITPSFATNLNQIPFTGLTLGPQNLDADRDGVPEYARVFFATAADGRVYAFDEFGSPVPVFADGASSMPIGAPGGAAQGLAFSTLDYNLWHVTNQRGSDPGHGINPTFDGSRPVGTQGGTSFYFGLEDPRANTTISNQPRADHYIPQAGDPRQQNVFNTYNLPGGAHGALTTDTFSLEGYTPTDKPTLYFNYYLQTQNANANTQQAMRDSFRVFISSDGVNWSQLATNNSVLSFPNSQTFAELSDHISASGGNYQQETPSGDRQRVQELYDDANPNDNIVWRQARVDLGDFAGLSNLRLRFDFSTAGTMNVGGLTVGQFLNALPGSQLRDGQSFSIDFQPFEFDSGFTLVAPAGAGSAIQDGEQFVISDGINAPVTFEFDRDGASSVPAGQTIAITSLDTAEVVAQKVAAAIAANFAPFNPGFGGITPHVNGHRVNLEGAVSLTQSAVVGLPRMGVQGSPGVTPGAVPIVITESMTDLEVAQLIAQAIETHFTVTVNGNMDLPQFQTTALLDKTRIQLPHRQVTSAGPLPVSSALQGDQFGNFFSSQRGQNNNFEGVYIDDIVIGFAERGEMVTGATANSNFFTLTGTRFTDPTPEGSEQLTGDYQLEIRRGQEYAQVINTATGQILLNRAIDTNDRLTQDFTLTMPPGNQIQEGQSFQISDGVNVVTFEFDSDGLFAAGAVPIPYSNVSTAAQLAQFVMNAINANALLTTLASANLNSPRVNLIGAAFVTSGGASLSGNLTAESNDTLAEAVDSHLSSATPGTFISTGVIGDNPNLPTDPSLDVDFVSFQLNAGDRVRIDIDAAQLGSSLDAVIRLFDANGIVLAQSDDNPAPGEGFTLDSYLEFVATTSGTYYVGVSGFDNFNYDPNVAGSGTSLFGTMPPLFSQGEYTLTIIVGTGVVAVDQYNFRGDENQFREQGQILIDSNIISHFAQAGILVDAGPRDAQGNIPHQASVRNTREPNVSRLVPGVAIQNNLITNVGEVGIRFSGDPNPANQPLAAVPFGRIVNNTIWGGPGPQGIGIEVTENASPTILNNILANLTTGVVVDPSSRTQGTFSGTVLSANLYRNAPTTFADTGAPMNGLGDQAIVLGPNDPLFENEALGVFSPARGSLAIDSSLDSLQDRPSLTTVTSPLGIGLSPILAPERDLNGQLRVDDPTQSPPPGMGANVFKDRGALEHVDQPRINVTGMSVTEGDLGTTNLLFTVTIDQFTNAPVTVSYLLISGTAQGGLDFVNDSGKITFLPGQPTTQIITVQVIGDTLDEPDETFVLSLSEATNALILNGQATGTIIDDDGAPVISITDVSVTEGNGPGVSAQAIFIVSLSQPSGQTISATFATANGTATAGQDYNATSGQLTFLPSETRKFITVDILGDTIAESNETFTVNLTQIANATPAAVTGTGTILEDEPFLQINNVAQAEGDAGVTNFVFTVTLGPPSAMQVTVQFNTFDGTATGGSDFMHVAGVLTFAPGETAKSFAVPVNGDTLVEGNETFTVVLSNPTNAGIGVATGTGTIINDDQPPPPPPPPPLPTDPFIVTGAGEGGGPHVRVLDAATLVERFSLFAYNPAFRGGVRVAVADVTGDGVDDIITVPGPGGGPHVRVFNGVDGQQVPGAIGSFFAFEPTYTGGLYVAAGDVNGDGRADLIIATQVGNGMVGEAGAARLRIFNGASGSQLREHTFRNGSPLAVGMRVAAGDINGDGRAEIIAAAGAGGGSRVQVIDPLSGAILRDFSAYGAFNGEVFVATGDINGDGRADIITAAGAGGGPHIRAFSGINNAELASFMAYNPAFRGGVRVATTDLNRDGQLDIITSPGFGGGPHVRVFSGVGQGVLQEFMAYNPLFAGGVFVGGSFNGAPLMAAQGQAAAAAGQVLTEAALQPIVEEAVARWAGAGIDAAALKRLQNMPVTVADLPDGYLALARADRIYVDVNGAGYGWFIDPTPQSDEEFNGGGAGINRMDLLTTILHEFGHVLGLDDLHDDDHDDALMVESLSVGRRRAPTQEDVDHVFSEDDHWLP